MVGSEHRSEREGAERCGAFGLRDGTSIAERLQRIRRSPVLAAHRLTLCGVIEARPLSLARLAAISVGTVLTLSAEQLTALMLVRARSPAGLLPPPELIRPISALPAPLTVRLAEESRAAPSPGNRSVGNHSSVTAGAKQMNGSRSSGSSELDGAAVGEGGAFDRALDQLLAELERIEPLTEAELPESNLIPPGSAPTRPALSGLLDAVRIKLTVELGAIELSLNDLLELGCGTTIDVTLAAGHPVSLTIDSQRIATGRLVPGESMLAIEITAVEEESGETEQQQSSGADKQ